MEARLTSLRSLTCRYVLCSVDSHVALLSHSPDNTLTPLDYDVICPALDYQPTELHKESGHWLKRGTQMYVR